MIKNLKRVVSTLDKRFNKLPEYYNNIMLAKRKYDAVLIKRTFARGIENDWFGLKRLRPETINQKRRKGFSSPEVPLLGKGGSSDRSYKNLFIIRKVKNGYTIKPSQKIHHSGKVKLAVLYKVHEYGKTIDTGRATIVIPQRPAGRESLKMARRDIEEKSFFGLSSSAFAEYMKKGKDNKIKKLIIKYNEGAKGESID